MARLVLGTRGSRLALWQARYVADLLREREPDLEVVERVIRSAGDLDPRTPIGSLGQAGAFVRAIETALIAGEIDIAVHSLKDLTTEPPDELVLAAVPEREDPRDALLTLQGFTLADLPQGTTVGTGSLRRRSQLLHARPDLRVVEVRGNVDTRVQKLVEGEVGALVLAMAGMRRLGIDSVQVRPIPPAVCVPAVGQGALAVEARTSDYALRSRLSGLTDPISLAQVTAERAFLHRLGGGCLAPASAHASGGEGGMVIGAFVADPDGVSVISATERCALAEARRCAEVLADRLLLAGATRLLQDSRARARPTDGTD